MGSEVGEGLGKRREEEMETGERGGGEERRRSVEAGRVVWAPMALRVGRLMRESTAGDGPEDDSGGRSWAWAA